MSAIFGIIQTTGIKDKEAIRKSINNMQGEVQHYGRDEQQWLAIDVGAVGCCLDKFGIQSQNDSAILRDEARDIVLVCDAQIYNKAELAVELGLESNVVLPNQQILLAAYLKWGVAYTEHVNGDFCCAIWDGTLKQLSLSRDHLGVRPLFYSCTEEHFCFATDYRALLALPFVSKALDETQLYSVISNTYHINPSATAFAAIQSLPAAHRLIVKGAKVKTTKYWSPAAGDRITCRNDEEYQQRLHAIVNDATIRRVNYFGAGVGAELSGGLDSSVIAILAAREQKKFGITPEMFSWTPSKDKVKTVEGDERRLIEAICKQEGFGCDYNDDCFAIDITDNAPLMPALKWDGGSVFPYELHLMNKKGVHRILSGQGGDEGASHRASLWEILRNGYPMHFLREIALQSKGSPLRFAKCLISNTIMRMFMPFSHFGNANAGELNIINTNFAKRQKKYCRRAILQFSSKPEAYIESGAMQLRTEVTAWLGAYYGTQHIFPLLDYRVLDYALSIPRYMHYRNGKSRYIYRQTFGKLLPDVYNGYFTKDDPAKSSLINTRAEQEWADTKMLAAGLDYQLFGKYIDQNKLAPVLSGKRPDAHKLHILGYKLQYMRNIQRLLRHAHVE